LSRSANHEVPHYALFCTVLLFPPSEDQIYSSAHYWQGTLCPDLMMCVTESSCVAMLCQRASYALYVHWVWEVAALQMNSNMTQERTTWQELRPSDLGHNPENRRRSHGNSHYATKQASEGNLTSKALRSTEMSKTLNGKFLLQYQAIIRNCFQR